jgi:hypothetical protein
MQLVKFLHNSPTLTSTPNGLALIQGEGGCFKRGKKVEKSLVSKLQQVKNKERK